MSDSVRPNRCQPTRLPHPWDSLGKNTGVGWHFLLQCMKVKVKLLSRVWLLGTPWTAAYQAPLSIGFSRQEYWSGVPLSSPSVTAKLLIYPSSTFPFGNHKFDFYICEFASVLSIKSFVSIFSIPHISGMWYLSFLVWSPLGPSEMEQDPMGPWPHFFCLPFVWVKTLAKQ